MTSIPNVSSKVKQLLTKGKGFLSVSGGKYADAILGGILWLAIVKFLTPNELGVLTYWSSIALMLASVTSLGFGISFKALLPKGKKKIASEGNLITLLPTLSFAFVLAYITPWSLFSVLAFFFFMNRYHLAVAEILGEQHYQEFFFVVLGKRLIQLVASLSLYHMLGVNGVLLGLTLGVAVTSYRSLHTLFMFSGGFDFSISRSHQTFLLYNFGRTAITGALSQLDRIFIRMFYGNEVLGIYAFIIQIFQFLCMVPQGFSGYLLPEKATGKSTKLAETVGISASVGVGILTFIVAPFGITWLFPEYTQAIGTIRLLGIVPVIVMFSTIFTSHLLSKEEGRSPFLAIILSRIVKVGGIVPLYRLLGVWGLGLARILAKVTNVIFLWSRKR